MKGIVVFSGSAHPALANEICRRLGVPLSGTDIKRFSNDCLQVQLLANCRQRDVYIVQPLVPPTQEHLMELLLMIDAARGETRKAIKSATSWGLAGRPSGMPPSACMMICLPPS